MQKKRFLAVLGFALLLSLVLAVVVAADCCPAPCPPPPCPPPPCQLDCSPGFWKNHDFWVNDYADGEHMMEILWYKGNNPDFELRWDVIYELNTNPAYSWVECDD